MDANKQRTRNFAVEPDLHEVVVRHDLVLRQLPQLVNGVNRLACPTRRRTPMTHRISLLLVATHRAIIQGTPSTGRKQYCIERARMTQRTRA